MYRVVFNPAFEQMEVNDFAREYPDIETARNILNAIADYTLMLHETTLMLDYSNYGYIESWNGEDWIEVE